MKIAVVAGSITELGIPLIKDLLAEGYKVFALTHNHLDLFYPQDLDGSNKPIVISAAGWIRDSWKILISEIELECDLLGVTPKVDLLVTLSDGLNPSNTDVTSVHDLEYAMARTVHPLFLSMPLLMPLIKESSTARIISVYPSYPEEGMSNTANDLAKVSADALVKSLHRDISSPKLYVNSLSYQGDDCNPQHIKNGISIIREKKFHWGAVYNLDSNSLVTPQGVPEVRYA